MYFLYYVILVCVSVYYLESIYSLTMKHSFIWLQVSFFFFVCLCSLTFILLRVVYIDFCFCCSRLGELLSLQQVGLQLKGHNFPTEERALITCWVGRVTKGFHLTWSAKLLLNLLTHFLWLVNCTIHGIGPWISYIVFWSDSVEFSGLLSRFSLSIGHMHLSSLKLVIVLVTKLMPCDRVIYFVSV